MHPKLTAKQQAIVNRRMQHFDIHSRHMNCIKLHKGTRKEHRDKIYEICTWCIENDQPFLTEAKLLNRKGRPDVVFLLMGIIFEVGHSETVEKFDKKNYPLPAYFVKSTDEWKGP